MSEHWRQPPEPPKGRPSISEYLGFAVLLALCAGAVVAFDIVKQLWQ